jgi:hypothetical protein
MLKAQKAPTFDNLDDVTNKFVATLVMYNKKAALVKAVHYQEDKGKVILDKFRLVLSIAQADQNAAAIVNLDDPLLKYTDYNLGYANHKKYAAWWYRVPLKQYRQGLKRDQMAYNVSYPGVVPDDNFGYSMPWIRMLENEYPSLDTVGRLLLDNMVEAISFHKNFALAWDNLHEDYILEFKGKKVGVSLNKGLTEYRLLPEFRFLAESLQEAIA